MASKKLFKAIPRPTSRSEIKQSAREFANKWEGKNGIHPDTEEVYKQTWWTELFSVFRLELGVVAQFEYPVPNLTGHKSFIDIFYPAVLIAEHKSRGCTGKQFDVAKVQALEYVQCLTREGRQNEVPRHIVLSDFETIVVYDLKTGIDKPIAKFKTVDIAKNIDALMFLAGKASQIPEFEETVDILAVEKLGLLHDAMEDSGYVGHQLQIFLVRCLFCLFAEDTDIFQEKDFYNLVSSTHEDGSDLGAVLAQAFKVLDTPITGENKRSPVPPEMFANLPYVSGSLFKENLGFASFSKAMREALLNCCELDWAAISPAIFGSLFQCVMEAGERRQVGAHYTSEADIMKVVRSLFLDDLEQELAECGNRKTALADFHQKISSLAFLDPACGCGNFLVLAYKHLRQLESECLERLFGDDFDPSKLRVSRGQMFGIEITEWAARIADVALILTERQEDQKILHGFSFTRLPLTDAVQILVGNALQTDWNSVLPVSRCSYVMGNPPFVGGKVQNPSQKADLESVTKGVKNAGLLDYVTGWYFKASEYIKGTDIRCAFVSTNSLSQGEQVGVLWGELLKRGIKIHFAYRTFSWESEARGKAHVHVVIIGFGNGNHPNKRIYDHDSDGEVTVFPAKNISPYLVEGNDAVIVNRSKPLCDVPEMVMGNQPIDDGRYLFTPEEKAAFIQSEPAAQPYFRRWLGGREFLNGIERWYLFLSDCTPSQLRSMPNCILRVEEVRRFRQASKRTATRNLASFPTKFQTTYAPSGEFLALAQVSSERRKYIPIAYLSPQFLAGDKLRCVENANPYLFGVLTSDMHMSWVRLVTGRLKSDFQYSAKLVYNNYPFPQNQTSDQRKAVEEAAQAVLDTREHFKGQTLADLYDPNTMPPDLTDAHAKLDRAVERCYRKESFKSERERVEYLFQLYEALQSPLVVTKKRRVVAKPGTPDIT